MIFLNIFLWNCDFIFYFILLVVGLFTNIVFSEIFDNLKEKLNFVAFIYDFLSAVISIFRSFLTYTTYVFVYKANVISVYNWNTIVIKPVQQYFYLINSAFIQLVVYAQIHISFHSFMNSVIVLSFIQSIVCVRTAIIFHSLTDSSLYSVCIIMSTQVQSLVSLIQLIQ